MKLFRFELLEDPGVARSGMVYGGKVYETSGAEAVAVHEAENVRPLPPLPHAASLRIFRSDLQPVQITETDEPRYFYGNTCSLQGASTLVELRDFSFEWEAECYVAAIIGEATLTEVDSDEAESYILGYTMVTLLVARDVEREERRLGVGFGRSYDLVGTIGPVITTPDELEEHVEEFDRGRKFGLEVRLQVNNVEVERGNLNELPITFAQAIASASRSAGLRVGDVIALGPIVTPTAALDPADQVLLSVEKLGALATKLAP
ncbi:MAG: fumarylacetoacetate hydrolase family protein [Fimbriimonas sp.]